MKENIWMLKEEFEAKEVQLLETVVQKEELEQYLSNYKNNFPEEFEFFL
jgi:hypothetical protein